MVLLFLPVRCPIIGCLGNSFMISDTLISDSFRLNISIQSFCNMRMASLNHLSISSFRLSDILPYFLAIQLVSHKDLKCGGSITTILYLLSSLFISRKSHTSSGSIEKLGRAMIDHFSIVLMSMKWTKGFDLSNRNIRPPQHISIIGLLFMRW